MVVEELGRQLVTLPTVPSSTSPHQPCTKTGRSGFGTCRERSISSLSIRINCTQLDKHTFAIEKRPQMFTHISYDPTLSRQQPLPTATLPHTTASSLTPLRHGAHCFHEEHCHHGHGLDPNEHLRHRSTHYGCYYRSLAWPYERLHHGNSIRHFYHHQQSQHARRITDTFTINSSSYIAARHPPSASPTYANHTYTLADTTCIDLPSSILTSGVKFASLPTLHCQPPHHSQQSAQRPLR
jgi:hypothetical protein